MSGTARKAAAELRASYALRTAVIPLHRPSRRELLPDRVFATRAAKLAAVAREVAARHAQAQPVLIGTRTIENSEALADCLAPLGFPIRILNAKQDGEEAFIIEQAGEPGVVTIATNIAGCGAHIPVPAESQRVGSLHVIGLERHKSSRITANSSAAPPGRGSPVARSFCFRWKTTFLSATRQCPLRGWRSFRPTRRANCPRNTSFTSFAPNAASKLPTASSAGSSRSMTSGWMN